MRQITITPSIEALAEKYQKMLTGKLPIATYPVVVTMNLPKYVEDLRNKFVDATYSIKEPYMSAKRLRWRNLRNRDKYAKYLKALQKRLDDGLLINHPSKFKDEIEIFSTLLTSEEMKQKMKLGTRANAKAKTFIEIIQETLCYKEIRQSIFPQFVRDLGIKTCVYCNSQFAVTDEDDRGYYQLDHWKPESVYPYLSVCFFNLQPSCASCNMHKRDDKREYHSIWNESKTEGNELYRFTLPNASLARYIMTHHTDELAIRIEAVNNTAHLALLKEKLYIDSLYDQFTDVAEEVVWKRMAFDQGYLKALSNTSALKMLKQSDVNRFILGTYDKPEDIHKRPLAKLTQDVAKQIGIF